MDYPSHTKRLASRIRARQVPTHPAVEMTGLSSTDLFEAFDSAWLRPETAAEVRCR
jgi:hypothetical protein